MTEATSTTSSLWRRLCHTRLRDVVRGRLDARLDWRQAVAQAELPESLADAATKVVGGTRLWRSEKADVANDLIAHFQDGLEFGHTPDELLKTFGDPQAAAQLIRRAKRRSRPLLWHVWHYGWMILLALVGLYIATGLWMSLGRPTIRTDYLTVINKVPAAVPEGERAWPIYRDAMLAMGMREDADSPVKKILSSDALPGDAEWKDKENFLTEHADSIGKLREAAERGNLGFVTSTSEADYAEKDRELFGIKTTPQEIESAKQKTLQDHWIIGALLPDLQALRQTSQLLADDARRAAIAGDGQATYDNVVALLGVSRHCQEMPFLVAALVSEAVQAKAHNVIREVLAEHAKIWTDAQLRDLAHQLAAARTDWQRGMEGQRLCFYDSMQRLYTDNGSGDGRLAFHVDDKLNVFQIIDMAIVGDAYGQSPYANRGLALMALPAANMTIASRKEMVELFDRLTSGVQVKIEEPYWKRAGETRWDEELKALANGPVAKYQYLFVNLLVPSYDSILKRVTVTDGERDGMFLGLALELYHRQHNKWPASLAELSPQYLPQLPVDSITGKPLHFKIVDDRPVVYSVGFDGDDDGGRAVPLVDGMKMPWEKSPEPPPADGDWVIWSTAKESPDPRKGATL